MTADVARLPICAHCGAPVPLGMVDATKDEQFCCGGCKAARQLIVNSGLGNYYRIVETAGAHVAGQAMKDDADRPYAEFDDPMFQSVHVKARADGVRQITLALSGIHCAGCLWLIEKLPQMLAGVREARVSIRQGEATISWDPAEVKLSAIASTLSRLGYTPRPARELAARERAKAEDRATLIKIAAAGALGGNVMMIAFALYGGYFHGMAEEIRLGLRWLSCVLGVVCLAWPGGGFFRSAWRAMITRTPSIDVPIVLALVAGGIAGVINTVLDRGDLYFDSLTMLVTLLLAGRFIGRRQQRWASDAVALLYTLTPFAARKRDNATGDWIDTPAESLAVGDVIQVRAGESIAVDGEVIAGESLIDNGLLTGESAPRRVSPLMEPIVYAGSVNTSAPIEVRATATGRETRAAKLMQIVEDAATRRAPIIRFADSIAGWFIIIVPLAALITFAAWWRVDHARALDNAIAVLIVTCPCVLGIAAPVAVALAIGRAGKDGVLIKGGDALERLARPGVAVLDKTGTLTEGKLRVCEVWGDPDCLELAAALEAGVKHPIAQAITDAVGETALRASGVRHTIGSGIRASVDGKTITVGSPEFVLGHCSGTGDAPKWLESAHEAGVSPVLVAADDSPIGAIGLGDRPRKDTAAAIERLKGAGWKVRVLSGDAQSITTRIGGMVGVPAEACEGGLTPERKLARVREIQSQGLPVLMVGDGVNDSAALAAADVGVAVHGGAEASLTAADVHISTPGLTRLADFVDAGPRMVGTIRRMFMVSLAYNLLAGGLAMAGYIHPMLAAALMPVSSLSTLAVAMRARVWRASQAPVAKKKCCGGGRCGGGAGGVKKAGGCCSTGKSAGACCSPGGKGGGSCR